MKKSELKNLIKEVVGAAIKEMVGPQPVLGQKYFKVTVQHEYIGPHYKGKNETSIWPNILANDEESAKKEVLSAYNTKVVKIHNIVAEPTREVSPADMEKYDKDVAGYAHAMRPKSQGGYGSH
jgi:hypothetical protein